MSLEKLVSKYVLSADHVFATMQVASNDVHIESSDVERVVESARAYLEDAKHYKQMRRFNVSLTSVAYCEGLLDALKLLGVVKFDWPSKVEEKEK